MTRNWDELPLFLSPAQVKEVLGIGRGHSYQIFADPSFPAVKIGNLLRVRRDEFMHWIDCNRLH